METNAFRIPEDQTQSNQLQQNPACSALARLKATTERKQERFLFFPSSLPFRSTNNFSLLAQPLKEESDNPFEIQHLTPIRQVIIAAFQEDQHRGTYFTVKSDHSKQSEVLLKPCLLREILNFPLFLGRQGSCSFRRVSLTSAKSR